MSANPVRDVIDELARQFKVMNANCEILTQEVNALHKHITENQNKKPRRRLSRAFGFSCSLQPSTSEFKDKTRNAGEMFDFVRDHYDDMKRRYICALDQLADMTIRFNRMVKEDLDKQAREKPLGESWEDFCKQPIKRNYKDVLCQTETDVEVEDGDGIGPALKAKTKGDLDVNLHPADLAEMTMAFHALRAEIKEKDKLNVALEAENRNLLTQIRRFEEFSREFHSAQVKILKLNPCSDKTHK